MNEINHWCVVCGVGYNSCDSCLNEKSFTPWRSITDSISHYKIFMILQDYNNKIISKIEAKAKLTLVDISGWENFKDGSKRLIEEILNEDIIKEHTNSTTSVTKQSKKRTKQTQNSDDKLA